MARPEEGSSPVCAHIFDHSARIRHGGNLAGVFFGADPSRVAAVSGTETALRMIGLLKARFEPELQKGIDS